MERIRNRFPAVVCRLIPVIWLGVIAGCGVRTSDAEPWGGYDAARERIERYRKADLTVHVIDADSSAVPGASVTVTMRRHAFHFGSVIDPKLSFTRTGPRPEWGKYHAMVDSLFNLVTFNNAMKWQSRTNADGSPNREVREAADACMRWLQARDITVRGHAVIWPDWQYYPAYVQGLPPDSLRTVLYGWIDEVMAHFRGELIDWDLVNEPVQMPAFIELLGRKEVVRWFERARAADPACGLFINENGMLDGTHTEAYKAWIAWLLEQGAPLDGIGMQGHVSTGDLIGAAKLERAWDMLNEFAAFGLPIRITEFDCEGTSGEDRQARCLKNALYLAFSHPAVDGFMLWGFWDGRHWRNTPTFGMDRAGLWYEDWTIKQAGQAWIDLVFGEWWTNETGTTDSSGRYRVRGFYGDYEITVSYNGRTMTVPAHLTDTGSMITVALPEGR